MSTQLSFTKYEKEYRNVFRERLGKAESTQDVRKFFFQTLRDMLASIPESRLELDYETIKLTPEKAPGWEFKRDRIDEIDLKRLETLFEYSDLDRILDDFAEKACNRYRKLDKNPEKTESKMWAVPGSKEQSDHPAARSIGGVAGGDKR